MHGLRTELVINGRYVIYSKMAKEPAMMASWTIFFTAKNWVKDLFYPYFFVDLHGSFIAFSV